MRAERRCVRTQPARRIRGPAHRQEANRDVTFAGRERDWRSRMGFVRSSEEIARLQETLSQPPYVGVDSRLTFPCLNVFRLREGLIADHRIDVDVDPLLAPVAHGA